MKPSAICCIAILAMSFSACAAAKNEVRNCPVLIDINYVGSTPNERGNLVGIFSITNAGKTTVYLPLENGAVDIIHSRYASTEQRPSGGNNWQTFNPILEEMFAPKAHMTVMPGQRNEFRFDANGLFLSDPQATEMEYSIVVKDVAGCTFRSVPFKP